MGRKISNVASAVWHVAPSCWNQMLLISFSSIFVNKKKKKKRKRLLLTVTASPCSFSKKNGPIILYLWIKVRTKKWLVLGASAFHSMRAGFLCPKCNNFAYLHNRQDRNEHHMKRWFFWPKSASSVSRSQVHFPAAEV